MMVTRIIVLLSLSAGGLLHGSMSANAIWEIRSTGSDSNGGCFVPGTGGTDLSGSTSLAMGTSNKVVTSSAHNFVAADVGKWINITAGTGWSRGWFQIVSTASNAATLGNSPSGVGNVNLATFTLYTGTDYSQQNAPRMSGSDLTVDASTNNSVAPDGYTPRGADVGNCVNITTSSGGWTPGIYYITNISNGKWVLDRSPAAAGTAGGTWASGGALGTITKGNASGTNSNTFWVTGSFTSSSTTTLSVGATPSNSIPPTRWIGYGSVRGDSGKFTLTLAANNGLAGIYVTGNGVSLSNVDVDCGSLASSEGISFGGSYELGRNIRVQNCKAYGVLIGGGTYNGLYDSEITANAGTAAVSLWGQQNYAERNYIHDNAATGVLLQQTGMVLRNNVIVYNSGSTSDGVQISYSAMVENNTIAHNGRDGIRGLQGAFGGESWRNNILALNGGYGLNCYTVAGKPSRATYDGNFYFGNGASGNGLNPGRNNCDDTGWVNEANAFDQYANSLDVVGTSNPFVNDVDPWGDDSGGANFMLNNTAGGGGAARGAGTPGTMAGMSQVGRVDMGALQHADSGGGTGSVN